MAPGFYVIGKEKMGLLVLVTFFLIVFGPHVSCWSRKQEMNYIFKINLLNAMLFAFILFLLSAIVFNDKQTTLFTGVYKRWAPLNDDLNTLC